MMTILKVRNVNEALSKGLHLLNGPLADIEDTRNGRVLTWPGPVVTETERPLERVLFSPMRDANPFFHLFESLWMLAGRNELPWLTQFNKQMEAYSDDGGKTQPAAYGHRWREYFGYDQLDMVQMELAARPNSRRAVLAMWNPAYGPRSDGSMALAGSADVPCNTHCYFRIRNGVLDMMVSCRSNDVLWGAHGANAVHFSVLLEYMAARLGVGVGIMYQSSFNYHLYDGILKRPAEEVADDALLFNYYEDDVIQTTPIFSTDTMPAFERDLVIFMNYAEPDAEKVGIPGLTHPFLRNVALPMLWAWGAHKQKNYDKAIGFAMDITPGDWQRASLLWLRRRAAAHAKKEG